MANYNSNYEIAQEISRRIGVEPVPFESVYEISLAIYNELGGEPAEFDSVYEILLGILPLVEGGIASKVIDDSVITTNKTWSSNKINEEIQAVAGTANSDIEGKSTEDFHFVTELPQEAEEDEQVVIKGENADTLYKYVSSAWVEQTPDANKLYFDTENEALYSYVTADQQFAPVSMVNTIVVGSNLNTNAALKAIKTPGVYSVVQRLHSTTKGDYIKNWTLTVEGIDYDEYERTDSIYQRIQSNYTIQKRTWSSTRVTNDGWSSFSTYYAGEIKDTTTSKYYTWSSNKLSSELAAKQDVISDLDSIRSGAALGATALQAVPAEYVTETEMEAAIAAIPQLEAGDNISIESNKINAKGYKFDEKNNAFAELGNIKSALEYAVSWEEVMGVDPDLYISGAANTTTYTITGTYVEYAREIIPMLQQLGGGLVMANGEKRLITSFDETTPSITFDRTVDAENAVENMKLASIYISLPLLISGAANVTTYSWTSTNSQVVLRLLSRYISSFGANLLFDDYGTKKITDITAQTISFDSTLDANNSISNVQPSGFEYCVNSATGIQSHAEGAAMAIGAYSHAEGCNKRSSVQAAADGEWRETTATYSWNSTDGYIKLTGSAAQEYLEVGDIVRYGGVLRCVKSKDGNNLIIDSPFNQSDTQNVKIEWYANGTIAYGMGSHAEGGDANASGDFSHAEGFGNMAVGQASHAEGFWCWATGAQAHVEGGSRRGYGFHTAAGNYSHAEGDATNTTGLASHAEGSETLAQNLAEHAEGCYNVSHRANDNQIDNSHPNGDAGNTQHSIGIGYFYGSSHRKNAVEVMTNGDMYVLGVGGYQGTDTKVQDPSIKTLQAYIASLEARITALEGNSTVE